MTLPPLPREALTGLVLAGGRGSRMGGVDKGLQSWRGLPLALQALMRLTPQVGELMVNANRNLSAYESFGVPVWPDPVIPGAGEFPGPLAGFLAGLERCETDWLLAVPCDTPNFPEDLAERLGTAAQAAGAPIALPRAQDADGVWRSQPAFCLVRADRMESLLRFLQAGGRKIDRWTEAEGAVLVDFPEASAFDNLNTLAELQAAQGRPSATADGGMR